MSRLHQHSLPSLETEMSVLGPHHCDAIHWVQWTDKEIANECWMEVVMCM